MGTIVQLHQVMVREVAVVLGQIVTEIIVIRSLADERSIDLDRSEVGRCRAASSSPSLPSSMAIHPRHTPMFFGIVSSFGVDSAMSS